MGSFEDLAVWRRAVALSVDIYRQTQPIKDFGFRGQITTAGLSIPSNIAEGMERVSKADKIRFLDYALGSCGEVRTQALIGHQVGYVPTDAYNCWATETREVTAMLSGLIRSIRDSRT